MPDPIDKSKDVQPDEPDTDQPETPEVDEGKDEKVETPDTPSDEDGDKPDSKDEPEDTKVEPEKSDFDPIKAVTSFKGFKKLPKKQQELLKKGFMLQSDYTKKTQGIANVRKQAEAYQKARPILDRVFADENLLNTILGGGSPQSTPQGTNDQQPEKIEYSNDPQEYAGQIIKQTMSKTQKLLKERDSQRSTFETHRADTNAAEKLDPRLISDKPFAQLVAGIVNSNPNYRARRMSAVDATKEAITQVDSYSQSQVKQGKQTLIDKAKNKKVVINKRSTGGSVVQGEKIASMRDAHKAAEAEAKSS